MSIETESGEGFSASGGWPTDPAFFEVSEYLRGSGYGADSPESMVTGSGDAGYPSWLGLPQYWRTRESSVGRPLRVIHVSLCLCRGGTESWLLTFRRFLNPRRARFVRCVVTNPAHVDPEVARELQVPVEAGGAESVRRAARDCDILVSWGYPIARVLGDVRPRVGIVVAHGDSDWTRDMAMLAAPVTDCFVAVSERVGKRLGPTLPVRVIPNGVDSARISRTRGRREVRAELGFADSDFVVGTVGRLSIEKRPEILIEAAARLPPRYKLLFVGWGELEPKIREQADRRIPGRYVITPASTYLGDYYHAMDAFCLMSEHEGYGLVLLEAMMCGRPTISTDVGAVGELLIHGHNGLVFDGTPSMLAGYLSELEQHPAWAERLGREAARDAEAQGHGLKMVRAYEDLFEQLWAEKTRGAGRESLAIPT